MKIGGVQVQRGGELPPLIFFRPGGVQIVIIAQPVHDLDEFHALVPRPTPDAFRVMDRSGEWKADLTHPGYQDLVKAYRRKKQAYIVLKTLEPSKIEWETVDMADPETWSNFNAEIGKVFSFTEIDAITDLVEEANSVNAEKMEAAREAFFRARAAAALPASALHSPTSDQASTLSGAPANDSESALPASTPIGTT